MKNNSFSYLKPTQITPALQNRGSNVPAYLAASVPLIRLYA